VLREIARKEERPARGVTPAARVKIGADGIEEPLVIPDRLLALAICSVVHGG
jgi:hypothetical protein